MMGKEIAEMRAKQKINKIEKNSDSDKVFFSSSGYRFGFKIMDVYNQLTQSANRE